MWPDSLVLASRNFPSDLGSALFGWQHGMTDYRISLIPLGGYVKMVGDEPDADIDPELKPLSFTHQSVGKRFLIVAAGPLFNLILAVAIFYGVFVSTGIYVHRAAVGEVGKDTPAEKAGIKPGDLIIDIDGVAILDWEGMKNQIGVNQGKPMSVTVDREGQQVSMDLTPQLRTIPNLLVNESRGMSSASPRRMITTFERSALSRRWWRAFRRPMR